MCWLSQEAFAMGIVEELFKTQSEFTIVFAEVFIAPRFGMILYPIIMLCGEFFDYSAWKRIC